MGALVADGFHPVDHYVDTASYGLPSDAVVEAFTTGITRWQHGIATMAEYDDAVRASRVAFASLIGASVDDVAVASQVSSLVGLIATSLPTGSLVLVPEGEFTSVLFPFLVQEGRLLVRQVPVDQLAAAVTREVAMVAFSLVHSATGRLADSAAIVAAAERHGTKLLVDATQAAGWLPFDPSRFDYVVASAYKWLLCPRGTAFLVVNPRSAPDLPPFAAGWYAGEEPWQSIYGAPLRLATTARRFDVSPGWLSWVAAAPALELLASVGVDAIHRHDVALADLACRRLGLASKGSAILTIAVDDASLLRDSGVRASVRAGSVRVGFHLYNSEADVDALVAALSVVASV